MKTRRLLALVAVLATATLWANAVPILGPAPTAEGLRRRADNARLFAGLFGCYGAPVESAYFQGRADAYAEIAAQIEASQPRTPTAQPGDAVLSQIDKP